MANADGQRLLLSDESAPDSRFRFSRAHVLMFALILFIIVIQRVGFEVIGAGSTRTTFLDLLSIFANCLAVGSCIVASRRSRGLSRAFWTLFAISAVLELMGNTGWAFYHYFHFPLSETALFPSLFYRLYAAPMAIALFLSEDVHISRLESFLDGCMVVGLVGVATYQVQMAELNAHDPKIWQLISMGTAVNGVLALVAFVRYLLSASGTARGLFARQSIFLTVYLLISFITSMVDAYFPNFDATVDIIWIIPCLTSAALAFTWRPPVVQEELHARSISRRTSLLCFNLTLATMVLGSAVLGLRLVNTSHVIGLLAVSLVMFSFAVRSALTRDTQEKYLAELQQSRAALEQQALYDELTGLPNRRLFAERLTQVLAISEREHQIAALFYMDLDGFKPVNDQFGHAIGDILLKRVALRMQSMVRKSDTIARMSGDEFTWLVAHLPGKEQAARLAKEMLHTLSAPYQIEGLTISVTASIGIALYPADATDPSVLTQQADNAMYAVKRDGKNGVRYSRDAEPE